MNSNEYYYRFVVLDRTKITGQITQKNCLGRGGERTLGRERYKSKNLTSGSLPAKYFM